MRLDVLCDDAVIRMRACMRISRDSIPVMLFVFALFIHHMGPTVNIFQGENSTHCGAVVVMLIRTAAAEWSIPVNRAFCTRNFV